MSRIKLLLRADDAGSSNSANRAMVDVIEAGIVKNISLMAVGPEIEEAARLLKDCKTVNFGLHLVLNSEWDKVKWGPLAKLTEESGLIDSHGYFLQDPTFFEESQPDLKAIMAEYEAQYQRLIELGFDLTYVDSHMMPEFVIHGLQDAVDQWATEKGLLNHADYYAFPPNVKELMEKTISVIKFFRSIPTGQYIFVIHPAYDSKEMRLVGNDSVSGDKIAEERHKEAKRFSSKLMKLVLKVLSIETCRYDEAEKLPRLDLSKWMN